ncbi:hypothetical protein OIDMADRAFT_45945 [Oidiodendron maius Zn]|uniref:Calcineurin-like phosphoesterase domain-containing protein n=1 Tax=Oidiodendron maius (strain Zn) TaxID=913774 RepID=A0A0C3GSF8_OIDMZ|nr:hypothetical protein OIDMADRAFT_45945 [Oidiodendron maius Zn]
MDKATVKTRLLIILDTHGMDLNLANIPFQPTDVTIHCGDLTDGSKLNEFRTQSRNHDFTLDDVAFEKKVVEAVPPPDLELVAKEYGTIGEAKKIFEDAKEVGIILLDEGTHHFTLQNGARLTVYASPYTPALGAWGFQYPSERVHNFSIEKGADIVMTNGPPKGIPDYTYGRERAGCAHLFAAVAHARPQLHCFGHIHEGWGVKLVTWQDTYGERPTHFTAIDNNNSHYPINNEQTLFVNASIEGSWGLLTQSPWLVDIELPRAVR